MQTPKYIVAISSLVLSLFVIIAFNQFGWLPKRLYAYDIYVEPVGPYTPTPQVPLDIWGNPTTPVQPPAQPQVIFPQPNLVAAWNFDQNPGSIVYDVSGNGRHATGSGAWRTGTDCKQGNCFGFIAEQRSMLSFSLTPLNTYTWSGWIKVDEMGYREQEIFNTALDSFGLTILRSHVQFYDGSSLMGATTLETGRYYHVAVTNDGQFKTIYIDGKADGSSAVSSGIIAGEGTMGAIAGDRYFGGTLDDIRLYDRALQPAEITALSQLQIIDTPAAVPSSYPTTPASPSLTAAPVVELGDIAVESFSAEWTDLKVSPGARPLNYRARIVNSGSADVVIPSNTQFSVICNSANCTMPNKLFGGLSSGSEAIVLRPGEGKTLDIPGADLSQLGVKPGTYDLMFMVDTAQLIREKTRENNTDLLPITLR